MCHSSTFCNQNIPPSFMSKSSIILTRNTW
nr:MAG TPA: hypothetical protein [Caudoviricetes sp.]